MTLDICPQVRHYRVQNRLCAKAALSVISVADPGFPVGAGNDAYSGCKSHNSGPIHTERKRKNKRMLIKNQGNFSLALTFCSVWIGLWGYKHTEWQRQWQWQWQRQGPLECIVMLQNRSKTHSQASRWASQWIHVLQWDLSDAPPDAATADLCGHPLNVLKIRIKFVCGAWERRCGCSSWIRHGISQLLNLGKSSNILWNSSSLD